VTFFIFPFGLPSSSSRGFWFSLVFSTFKAFPDSDPLQGKRKPFVAPVPQNNTPSLFLKREPNKLLSFSFLPSSGPVLVLYDIGEMSPFIFRTVFFPPEFPCGGDLSSSGLRPASLFLRIRSPRHSVLVRTWFSPLFFFALQCTLPSCLGPVHFFACNP